MIADRLHSGYSHIADQLNEVSWLPNLLVRISVGFMFFSGAVGKLGDVDKFVAMFNSLGIPAASLVAPATAVVEPEPEAV